MFVAEVENVTMVKVDAATLKLWRKQGRETSEWDISSIAAAVERVNRGAQLLDVEKPGWEQKVSPQDLHMNRGEFCIIGQVYGEYDEHVGIPFGIDLLEGDGWDGDVPESITAKARAHGFMEGRVEQGAFVSFPLLDRVWVYLLTARAHEHNNRRVFLTL